MRIRTRLTLWYAGILLLCIFLITMLSLHELQERRESPSATDSATEENLEIVLWVGLPAVLLSIGGWWLMRATLNPVTELTRAAERITERNLGERLPRSGNGDELDRLTEVFNAMIGRLDASFRRIREFTLHASHELKTPLTIMHGELETALQDGSLTSAEREHIFSQLNEVQRLTKIVDGLTLLTKADAGQVNLSCKSVRMDSLVREAFEDAQVLSRPYQIKVQLAECDPATVFGDPHRLRQLLLNLADNAAKYNMPGGTICMSLTQKESTVEFVISNTGPGIALEKLPRVFDRFYRGDESHNNTVEGCGLGLSIAQWIVTAHGGTIQITSEPGKQTVVTIRIPAEENKAEAPVPEIHA